MDDDLCPIAAKELKIALLFIRSLFVFLVSFVVDAFSREVICGYSSL
jgi:hypothetical protein